MLETSCLCNVRSQCALHHCLQAAGNDTSQVRLFNNPDASHYVRLVLCAVAMWRTQCRCDARTGNGREQQALLACEANGLPTTRDVLFVRQNQRHHRAASRSTSTYAAVKGRSSLICAHQSFDVATGRRQNRDQSSLPHQLTDILCACSLGTRSERVPFVMPFAVNWFRTLHHRAHLQRQRYLVADLSASAIGSSIAFRGQICNLKAR